MRSQALQLSLQRRKGISNLTTSPVQPPGTKILDELRRRQWKHDPEDVYLDSDEDRLSNKKQMAAWKCTQGRKKDWRMTPTAKRQTRRRLDRQLHSGHRNCDGTHSWTRSSRGKEPRAYHRSQSKDNGDCTWTTGERLPRCKHLWSGMRASKTAVNWRRHLEDLQDVMADEQIDVGHVPNTIFDEATIREPWDPLSYFDDLAMLSRRHISHTELHNFDNDISWITKHFVGFEKRICFDYGTDFPITVPERQYIWSLFLRDLNVRHVASTLLMSRPIPSILRATMQAHNVNRLALLYQGSVLSSLVLDWESEAIAIEWFRPYNDAFTLRRQQYDAREKGRWSICQRTLVNRNTNIINVDSRGSQPLRSPATTEARYIFLGYFQILVDRCLDEQKANKPLLTSRPGKIKMAENGRQKSIRGIKGFPVMIFKSVRHLAEAIKKRWYLLGNQLSYNLRFECGCWECTTDMLRVVTKKKNQLELLEKRYQRGRELHNRVSSMVSEFSMALELWENILWVWEKEVEEGESDLLWIMRKGLSTRCGTPAPLTPGPPLLPDILWRYKIHSWQDLDDWIMLQDKVLQQIINGNESESTSRSTVRLRRQGLRGWYTIPIKKREKKRKHRSLEMVLQTQFGFKNGSYHSR